MMNENTLDAASNSRVILYLEDDDPTAYMFDRVLRDLNSAVLIYHVADCASARAFLSRTPPFVDVPRPHVVVLDINVSGDSGLSVLRAMRSDPELAQIPVIIFTASTAASDRKEASENLADGYLVKTAELAAFTSAAELVLRLAA